MGILDRLLRRTATVETPEEVEEVVTPPCLHTALTARWNTVQEMGDEDKATGWFCETCHETFTPEEGRELRASEGERLASETTS